EPARAATTTPASGECPVAAVPDQAGAALDCSGLTVCPGGNAVLRGLSFAIQAGTRTALVGPSGAGKTTLLRAIAGLDPLEEGTIALGDRPLAGIPPHRRRIAVVFQEPRLLPHLDVQDNVALPLRAAGVRKRERRERARERLGAVGLGGFHARRVAGLSGGEQQRVALARALCAEPELLLLDEPLAALDPNRREELRRLIVRLQEERGLTTLIVTHDRAEAAELGHRVALMLEGRIVQHDEPRALFERPVSAAVARFFGVANLIADGGGTLAIRPEHVRIDAGAERRAVVVESVYSGSHVRLVLDAGGQRIEALVSPADAPAAGQEVGVEFPPEQLWRLPEA
nr:ABC transporter ATP-binding protein [Solirubrobacterales bacterium]